MKLLSPRGAALALVVLSFAIAGAAYPWLPEQIPTHWNARGEIDDTTAKPLGPFVGPLILAFVWIVLSVAPAVSPRGYRIDEFRQIYDRLLLVIVLFLFEFVIVTLVAAAGRSVPIREIVLVSIGVLLVILGNYMGKVRRNFFLGIRTPWTLASEEVWLRTHRLGGKLFVAAGVVSVILGLTGFGPMALMSTIVTVSVLPIVYSYVVYRDLEKSGKIET